MGSKKSTKRERISVAMMVKNEEEFLDESLKTAKRWVDEIIVVDTGSTDSTVEIAERHGAKVSYFEWCDDFSAARNESLRRANGDWVLILDADERLQGDDPKKLREFLRTIPKGYPFHVVMLEVINTSLAGKTLSKLSSVRLMRNDSRLGYRHRVHNEFASLDPKLQKIFNHRYDGLKVIHLGYDPAVYRRRKKDERSLPLIEATVRDDPDNLCFNYYLGREYLRVGRIEEAIEVLESTIRRLREQDEPQPDVYLDTYWHLIESYRVAKVPLPKILETTTAALSVFPKSADIWFLTACTLIDADFNQKAVQYLQRALVCLDDPWIQTMRVNHMGGRRWEICERLGHLCAELNQIKDAYAAFLQAIEHKPDNALGWSELLNSTCALGIDLGDQERIPLLLELILSREDVSLEMFFLVLDRTLSNEGLDVARQVLERTRSKHARIATVPEYADWAARLGLD